MIEGKQFLFFNHKTRNVPFFHPNRRNLFKFVVRMYFPLRLRSLITFLLFSVFLVSSQILAYRIQFLLYSVRIRTRKKLSLPIRGISQKYELAVLDGDDRVLDDGVATNVTVDQNILIINAIDTRSNSATNIQVVG